VAARPVDRRPLTSAAGTTTTFQSAKMRFLCASGARCFNRKHGEVTTSGERFSSTRQKGSVHEAVGAFLRQGGRSVAGQRPDCRVHFPLSGTWAYSLGALFPFEYTVAPR